MENSREVIPLLSYLNMQAIKDWKELSKDVYVYFNNTIGDAIKNLITLNGFIKAL